MKEVYEERKAGEDLDAEYGNNVGGPPKNRRAGKNGRPPKALQYMSFLHRKQR